jgi:tRNA nucleotidyltransferase (CCA-adding enzyme)
MKYLIGFSFITPHFHFYKKKIGFLNSIYEKIIWFKKEFPRKRALDTWLMYFIGLINDLKIIRISAICKKFAFSRGETKRILSYKTIIDKLEKKLKKRLSAGCVYKLLEPLSYEVIVLLMARSSNKVLHKNIKEFLDVYNGMRIHVTGDDLALLGIPVGPNYKRILNKVLYAKLDKKINTREEELSFVKKLIKR